MKIAVTTPAGQVGSAATRFLLDQGNLRVKVLGRRPSRMRAYINRGAQMGVGSLDDEEFLIRETREVDALFWVTPPGYGSDNVRAYQNRLARAAAKAIRHNGISRVVNLSSIGADMRLGAGLFSGLYDVEKILDEATYDILHLRPGFFFENLLLQLDDIRKWGRISTTISGTISYPMIAARDVGRAAAEKLLSSAWSGHNINELHGPADLCFNQVAQILSETTGRKIFYYQSNRREAREHLIESSLSENAADLLLEMYDGIEWGKIKTTQPRSPHTTTSTTLTEFAHDTLLPRLAAAPTY